MYKLYSVVSSLAVVALKSWDRDVVGLQLNIHILREKRV